MRSSIRYGPPEPAARYGAGMPIDLPPALQRRHRIKQLGNRVNLSTPLGLAMARLGRATVRPGPRGLLLAEGYRLPFPVAGAFTVGNVVLTAGRFDPQRPGLLEHEERHSWQWYRCGGLPFLPAYGACLVWSLLRTGDLDAGNVFERRAGLALGGYAERPVRPLGPVVRAALGRRRRGGGSRSRS